MGKQEPNIQGIRIQTLNRAMILTSCLLYAVLILASIYTTRRYQALISATDSYVACEKNAALLSDGSDYLTEQVRLYTVTMDPGHLDDYFGEVRVTRRRETALERLKSFDTSPETRSYLQTALDSSNSLMEREIYAMKLIAVASGCSESRLSQEVRAVSLTGEDRALSPEEQVRKGQDMVFGPDYQQAKEQIEGNVDLFLNGLIADTRQHQQNSASSLRQTLTVQQILISVLFAENLIIFFLITKLIVKPLQVYVKCIREEKMLEVTGSYEFKYLALTYNDIYELNAANELMLRHQAEHDPLTGLMNRGAFDKIQQILKAKTTPVALMIVDVDKFKEINDGYGHETGDRVLQKVARLLEGSFRSTDFPARIGGDEFAVILTDADPGMTAQLRDKVNAVNHVLTNPSDGLPRVSLSVGVAFSGAGFDTGLYKRADSALYQVKEHGRCGCAFFGEAAEASGSV